MHEDTPQIPVPHQLDQRWITRYRYLLSYDSRWWGAVAGPFTEEEEQQWNHLITCESDLANKGQLDRLLVETRNREIDAALSEQREPHFHYPVLPHVIDALRQRIAGNHQLDREIQNHEPHPIIRRLYHDAIIEEVDYLHLLETGYTGDTDRYWELTRLSRAVPTRAEMVYVLERVKAEILEGLRYQETAALSHMLISLLRDRFQLPTLITNQEIAQERESATTLPARSAKPTVSAQAARRFFLSILHESGFTEWSVDLDPKAEGASVSSVRRQLRLSERALPLEQVRHLLAHEIAGHAARTAAGEQSPLGLLATGTAGYSETEEGLALYNERHTAKLHGEPVSDVGPWLGTLAVGLAGGIVTPPQSFTSLLAFFEPLMAQRRLIHGFDATLEEAQKQAKDRAISRCLRTFRGVPDLTHVGVVSTKDVVYLRGFRLIERAVAQDATIVDRLAAGKFGLHQLDDIEQLGMTAPPRSLRERAFDPDLDALILSFESNSGK
jgi:hypothetical protein